MFRVWLLSPSMDCDCLAFLTSDHHNFPWTKQTIKYNEMKPTLGWKAYVRLYFKCAGDNFVVVWRYSCGHPYKYLNWCKDDEESSEMDCMHNFLSLVIISLEFHSLFRIPVQRIHFLVVFTAAFLFGQNTELLPVHGRLHVTNTTCHDAESQATPSMCHCLSESNIHGLILDTVMAPQIKPRRHGQSNYFENQNRFSCME